MTTSVFKPAASPARGWLASRWIAFLIFGASSCVLAVALYLTPAGDGADAVGTHQGLGLPPCNFKSMTGLPCMTCGYTTAYALAVRGRIVSAWIVQPMGATLALATGMAWLASLWGIMTGARLGPMGRSLNRPATYGVLGALVLLAWGYKLWVSAGGH